MHSLAGAAHSRTYHTHRLRNISQLLKQPLPSASPKPPTPLGDNKWLDNMVAVHQEYDDGTRTWYIYDYVASVMTGKVEHVKLRSKDNRGPPEETTLQASQLREVYDEWLFNA